MNKRVLVLLGLLCLTSIAYAQVSTNYDLSWHVIGGGAMDSTSYALRGTVGQIIWSSESSNYRLGAGYWNGVEKYKPKKCGDVAPCPDCDGVVDIDDVTLLLNHVGNPGIYPLCNDRAGDVNCDGFVNMGDVILLLNYIGDPDRYNLNCCEA